MSFLQLYKVLPGIHLYLLTNRKLHPIWCYFGIWGRIFCDRGREAGSEGREVGDEGAGSGYRRGGKLGSSTPLSTPTYMYHYYSVAKLHYENEIFKW